MKAMKRLLQYTSITLFAYAWHVIPQAHAQVYLDFTGANFTSYSGSQDGQFSLPTQLDVEDDGITVRLTGNAWKKTSYVYNVSADTLLEFEFRNTAPEAELHGIGLESNDDHSDLNTIFEIAGTQTTGTFIGDFKNYTGTDWQFFSLPIGQYYTGSMSYIAFVHDDDLDGDTSSYFRNIRIVESIAGNSPPVITSVTATPASGDAPLLVSLAASATDSDLDPLNYTWDSTLEGNLGNGANLNATLNMVGSHNIFVTVGDGTNPDVSHSTPVTVNVPANGTANFPTKDDTYGRGGSDGNNNYGDRINLIVKDAVGDDYDRISYIKFDLTALSADVDSALLVLVLKNVNSASAPIELREVGDDSWDEMTLVWNDRPATGSILHSFSVVDTDIGNEIALDITSYLNAQRVADGQASLAFVQPGSADIIVEFFSNESAAMPYIEVTTSNGGGGSNSAPSITSIAANPLTGSTPLSVALAATASDQDSDPISYNWSSDLDGVLGTGAALNTTLTTVGTHTITLSVSDGVNPAVSGTLNVTVTTVSPTGPLLESAGLVVFEAENYDDKTAFGSQGWTLESNGGASDGDHMVVLPNAGNNISSNYVGNSPRIDYLVNFSTTGTYYVWTRMSGPGSGNNSIHIGLDGIAIPTGTKIEVQSDGSYTWVDTNDAAAPVQINITTAGVHMLNVWMREDGTRIDKFILTTDVDYTDPGADTGPFESLRDSGNGNSSPVINSIVADPTSGETPLNVVLAGDAMDLDDDPLTYTWLSDLDGSLGNGSSINSTLTTVGSHLITLQVSDGINDPVTATTAVTVNPQGVSPNPYLESSGLVVIEAENYDSKIAQGQHNWELNLNEYASEGEQMLAAPNASTSNNTGYVQNSPRMDYAVNFSTTGTYYIWVRALATNTANDSLHMGLNGSEVSTADRISPSSGGNHDWTNDTMDGVRAILNVSTPGIHTVNIWMREDGIYVDKFILTTDANYSDPGNDIGPAATPRAGASNNSVPVIASIDANPSSGETPLSITLTGSATDADSDPLTYTWSSDIDGTLGTGASLSTVLTTIGNHVVTLSVSDGINPAVTSTINVTVNSADGSIDPTGLIAHYRMDEGSGSISVNETGLNNGALQGGASWSSAGQLNGAVSLDGSDDWVNLDNGDNFLKDAFTQRSIALWVKHDGTSGSQTIYDEGGFTRGIGLRVNNGELQGIVRNGTSSSSQLLSSSNFDTDWHHVALVFEGSGSSGLLRLYVDGIVVTEDIAVPFGIVDTHQNDPALGARNSQYTFDDINTTTGAYFDGLLDDVYVYNRALSASEVATLFSQGNVNSAPIVVSVAANPLSGEAPLSITLTGSATDADSDPLTYAWSSDLDGAVGSGASLNAMLTTIGTHVVTLSVADGVNPAVTGTVNVTVINASSNVAPGIASVSTSPATGSTPLSITLSAMATDADNDPLTYTWSSDLDGALGTGASLNTTLTTIGTHVVTLSVSDGINPAVESFLSVAVNGVANTGPIATDDIQIGDGTMPIQIEVLDNDTSVNSADVLSIAGLTQPTHGSATTDGSIITYTPASGYYGTDTFTYRASDGIDESDAATVTVIIYELPNSGTRTEFFIEDFEDNHNFVNAITVARPVAPTGFNGNYVGAVSVPDLQGRYGYEVLNENNVDLVATIIDPAKTETIIVSALVGSNSSLLGVPYEMFIYIAFRGDDGEEIDYESVRIHFADYDYGQFDQNAELMSFAFPVPEGAVGIYSLEFEFLPLGSGARTIYLDDIRITDDLPDPVNNLAPIAINDSYSLNQDKAFQVDFAQGVLTNDRDPNLDSMSAILISVPQHGMIAFESDGTFTYRPESGYFGPDSFTYLVNDGIADSNVATVSLDVLEITSTPRNDYAPVILSTYVTPESGRNPLEVTLSVSAVDFFQYNGLSYLWTSDLEGVLGNVENLVATLTVPGTHTITATVDDGLFTVVSDPLIVVVADPALAALPPCDQFALGAGDKLPNGFGESYQGGVSINTNYSQTNDELFVQTCLSGDETNTSANYINGKEVGLIATLCLPVEAFDSDDPEARAGVIMQSDETDADSPFVRMAVKPGGGTVLEARFEQGGETVLISEGEITSFPVYVCLMREGNKFFGIESVDNLEWNTIGEVENELSTFGGLFTAATNTVSGISALFGGVSDLFNDRGRPIVEIVVNPDIINADNQIVTLDGSRSRTRGEATIVSYQWDLPNATVVSGSSGSSIVGVTYDLGAPAEGTRQVKLTVTDSDGKKASRTRYIVTDPHALNVIVSASPAFVAKDTSTVVVLDGRLSIPDPGPGVTYEWLVTDQAVNPVGTFISGQDGPLAEVTLEGRADYYVVELTVTNSRGEQIIDGVIIPVRDELRKRYPWEPLPIGLDDLDYSGCGTDSNGVPIQDLMRYVVVRGGSGYDTNEFDDPIPQLTFEYQGGQLLNDGSEIEANISYFQAETESCSYFTAFGCCGGLQRDARSYSGPITLSTDGSSQSTSYRVELAWNDSAPYYDWPSWKTPGDIGCGPFNALNAGINVDTLNRSQFEALVQNPSSRGGILDVIAYLPNGGGSGIPSYPCSPIPQKGEPGSPFNGEECYELVYQAATLIDDGAGDLLPEYAVGYAINPVTVDQTYDIIMAYDSVECQTGDCYKPVKTSEFTENPNWSESFPETLPARYYWQLCDESDPIEDGSLDLDVYYRPDSGEIVDEEFEVGVNGGGQLIEVGNGNTQLYGRVKVEKIEGDAPASLKWNPQHAKVYAGFDGTNFKNEMALGNHVKAGERYYIVMLANVIETDVTLNRNLIGDRISLSPALPISVTPDNDRDGVIEDSEFEDSYEELHWWINVAGRNDAEEYQNNSIIKFDDGIVNGAHDVMNFVDVALRLDAAFLANLGSNPGNLEIRIRQEEENQTPVTDSYVNVITPDELFSRSNGLSVQEINKGYFSYPSEHDLRPTLNLLDAEAIKDMPSLELNDGDLTIPMSVLTTLQTAARDIHILLEGRKVGSFLLVFEIYNPATDKVLGTVKQPITFHFVDQMFKQWDLSEDQNLGSREMLDPGFEASLGVVRNNYVLVHGFSPLQRSAFEYEIWLSGQEAFKRLYSVGMNGVFHFAKWQSNPVVLLPNIPLFRDGFPDYYGAVREALSPRLKDKLVSRLDSLVGTRSAPQETIGIGHSLGNMLMSASIEDLNAPIDDFVMWNAAIPSEAFYSEFDIETDRRDDMIHPAWRRPAWMVGSSLEDRLKLSMHQWHTLFPSSDGRSELTWIGRFKNVKSKTRLFNLYSSTDESFLTEDFSPIQFSVFGLDAQMLAVASARSGNRVWQMQELFKGRYSVTQITGSGLVLPDPNYGVPSISGTHYGGWGYSLFNSDGAPLISVPARSVSDILDPGTGAPNQRQLERPWFSGACPTWTLLGDEVACSLVEREGGPIVGDPLYGYLHFTGLYELGDPPVGGRSQFASKYRDRFLAETVPALTYAVGRESITAKTGIRGENLQAIKKSELSVPYPNASGFQHNDMFDVPLHFLVPAYQKTVDPSGVLLSGNSGCDCPNISVIIEE